MFKYTFFELIKKIKINQFIITTTKKKELTLFFMSIKINKKLNDY